jgi:alpha-glucosidase (family GH31 glycosyl hydrolase)
MWGSNILFSPIVVPTDESRSAYFPDGSWYNYFTSTLEFEGPVAATLEVPAMETSIHLRGGGIIPVQEPAVNTMLR